MNPGEDKPDHVIGFDPENPIDRQVMMECAKATGAFPIGLQPRLLKGTSLSYVKGMVKRMFTSKDNAFRPENIGIDIIRTRRQGCIFVRKNTKNGEFCYCSQVEGRFNLFTIIGGWINDYFIVGSDGKYPVIEVLYDTIIYCDVTVT